MEPIQTGQKYRTRDGREAIAGKPYFRKDSLFDSTYSITITMSDDERTVFGDGPSAGRANNLSGHDRAYDLIEIIRPVSDPVQLSLFEE